jgi:hypothetical protein
VAVETSENDGLSSGFSGIRQAHALRRVPDERHTMTADIWTFPPAADSLRFLTGYEVKALNGRVGRIDDNSLAADSAFIVVDTGWWIFERKRLIPSVLISSISGPEGKIYLTMTKREVREAPVYKPIEHSSESGRYNDYYGHP